MCDIGGEKENVIAVEGNTLIIVDIRPNDGTYFPRIQVEDTEKILCVDPRWFILFYSPAFMRRVFIGRIKYSLQKKFENGPPPRAGRHPARGVWLDIRVIFGLMKVFGYYSVIVIASFVLEPKQSVFCHSRPDRESIK